MVCLLSAGDFPCEQEGKNEIRSSQFFRTGLYRKSNIVCTWRNFGISGNFSDRNVEFFGRHSHGNHWYLHDFDVCDFPPA